MYKKMIINYINNKLTVNDINFFANKNNIILKDNEDKIIYSFIKKYYLDILNKNDLVFKNLNVSNETYKVCLTLYNTYKNKI